MWRQFILPKTLCLILIFHAGLGKNSLRAQDSNNVWNVYLSQYPNGIGSTMVNLSYHDKAPVKKTPHCVIIGASFSGCTFDGMPMEMAWPELYRFSDSVSHWINQKVANHAVGIFTYRCERSNYYYVSDTTGLRATILGKLKDNYFSFIKPYIAIQTDSLWNLYRTFIYPNEEARESMLNKDVLLRLSSAGDNLKQVRKIEHMAYFATPEDRECFITYALKNRFVVVQKDSNENSQYPFRLVLSRADIPELQSISKLTLALKREAIRCKGIYDGWESPVVK
jgi:hypothetical protein